MNRPRTPMNWPRMKIRGAGRKRKTSDRITYRTVLAVVPTTNADGSYRFRVASGGDSRAMQMVVTRVTDGWGRSMSQKRAPAGKGTN